MGIQIKWNCNLDRAASFCLPRYSFRRLDTRDTAHNVSPGHNFRWVRAWAPCLMCWRRWQLDHSPVGASTPTQDQGQEGKHAPGRVVQAGPRPHGIPTRESPPCLFLPPRESACFSFPRPASTRILRSG